MARTFFVGGNWKCNGSVKSLQALVDTFNGASLPAKSVVEVVVAPTALHMGFTKERLTKDIQLAAQNCWVKGSGAYTGEVSADILADYGIPWVILGHSERRSLLSESSQVVADKTSYALSKGVSVILCVGETLEEREAGKAESVIADQLQPVNSGIKDWKEVVIAYEPVWAIGTGKVATPDQAQAIHAFIRGWLHDKVSPDVGQATRIIYGGSVSAGNCTELAREKDIDGFLVGGASLKPDFLQIIKAGESK